MEIARPEITIEYCTQCNWMLRATWLAQELLHTFGQDIARVTLIPGTGGVFVIKANDQVIWDRRIHEGFPEAKVLKQKLRDLIWPERKLGHSDR